MGKDEEKEKIEFLAFEPLLKPLGGAHGGGFRLQIDISESEYQKIIPLLDPSLKNVTLQVKITPSREL